MGSAPVASRLSIMPRRFLRATLALGIGMAAVSGCTAAERPAAKEGAPHAKPSLPLSQQLNQVPGTEVRAESSTLETWALLYQPTPWRAGEEVKVVWRTTGTGAFEVVAVGPDSQVVQPISGPTPHFDSNWGRPGDEWGTFFRLDAPGKWMLRVERGQASASLAVTVIAA